MTKKRGGGRKDKSGLKSSINPQRDSVTESREKLFHGHRDWRIVRLRKLIGDSSKLADNYLSARQTERTAKVAEIRYELGNTIEAIWRERLTEKDQAVLKRLRSRGTVRKLTKREKEALRNEDAARRTELKAKADAGKRVWAVSQRDEIDALWNTLSAQFERAVLDGNTEWFHRQAKAIRWCDKRAPDEKARSQFEGAAARELEIEFWRTRIATTPEGERESVTLETAGKRLDKNFAQRILDRLEHHREGIYLFVEGRRFRDEKDARRAHRSAESRARDAITRIAELHGYVADSQSVETRSTWPVVAFWLPRRKRPALSFQLSNQRATHAHNQSCENATSFPPRRARQSTLSLRSSPPILFVGSV